MADGWSFAPIQSPDHFFYIFCNSVYIYVYIHNCVYIYTYIYICAELIYIYREREQYKVLVSDIESNSPAKITMNPIQSKIYIHEITCVSIIFHLNLRLNLHNPLCSHHRPGMFPSLLPQFSQYDMLSSCSNCCPIFKKSKCFPTVVSQNFLVGGLEHFLFSLILGIIIPLD